MQAYPKFLLLVVTLLFPYLSIAQKQNTHRAFTVYRSYLDTVEDYLEGRDEDDYDFEGFQEKIKALEKVTGIRSNDDGSCFTGFMRQPVSYNLEDWKQWLELNKELLILDEENETLKTTSNPEPIKRDPDKYFLTLVNELEEMLLDDVVIWDKSLHIIGVLDPITDYRDTHHSLQCSCDESDETYPYGTLHHVTILKEWYAKNSHRLYWDLESQSLKATPEM
ncbi:hypothetical protein POV27_03205 [Aureisphaera galaxeae]|uniref:hypothetical protein n=1 Tax=Aureisphaera galaxeae TaxID=1538023 RepID=UPI00235036A8|nr:hypothetical protein [Aureisphaera galaxeae]MDC8003041.1 hypothetical protein [Aureisphaera galaxeae]